MDRPSEMTSAQSGLPASGSDLPLNGTPALEGLLTRLRGRLRSKVWLHGLGTLLLAVSAWLVFAFVADRGLHVPKGVRWFHLAVLLALPVAVLWRELFRHLRRVPGRAGLAVLLERAWPQDELLVSAVELQQAEHPDGERALVERVLSEADRRAASLALDGVLDERAPRRRFALGAAAAAVLVAAGLAQPIYGSIFLRRLVGQDVPWPQLTWLTLSIPNLSEEAQITKSDGLIEVRVARGTDVPVLVRAEGRVPTDVTLHFGAGHKAVLAASGDGLFRTLLRSCQEDLEFHATGGDDRDGEPRVRVLVLDPPDVTGLAVRVEPPAYTGLGPRVVFDSDVEVLAGSRLTVVALPWPAEATGRVQLLPEGRWLDLEPRPFPDRDRPLEPGAARGPDARTGLGFELTAHESLRLRIALEDGSGLANPDPGLFAVQVVPDREPEVELVSPGRTEIDTVPGGLLALRARARDDFGLAAVAYTVRAAREEAPRAHPLPFGADAAETAPVRSALAARRLEVAALASPGSLTDEGQAQLTGEQFLLDVRALDSRPEAGGARERDDAPALDWALSSEHPGVGRSSPLRVRVLTEDEFLRRVQDRLARLRLDVTELEELQRQKSLRVRELITILESDDPDLGSDAGELGAALSGERRVRGDAEAVARELAAVVESVLFARIDEKAAGLLESLDARLAADPARTFRTELWTDLVADWRGQRSASPGLADQLVRLVDLALEVATGPTARATAALEEATGAVDLAGVHAALVEADRHQTEARAKVEQLLGLLGEWDNFQSILTLTRDILNRQKALRDRTREHAREK